MPVVKVHVSESIAIDAVVHGFVQGMRPEEIQAEHRILRLSQVYAIIAAYLDQRERHDSQLGRSDPAAGDGEVGVVN